MDCSAYQHPSHPSYCQQQITTSENAFFSAVTACGCDRMIETIDPEEIADFGEANLQLLLNAGLNVFAIELLAESYVRSPLPDLKRPTRLTCPFGSRAASLSASPSASH